MNKTNGLECFFDGSCWPNNPNGNMGLGACIKENGVELWKYSHTIPAAPGNSNNYAEYMALECILEYLIENNVTYMEIVFKGDSMLVIEQMSGRRKIKNGMYAQAAHRCLKKVTNLKNKGNNLSFVHIPREENSYCDSLSGGDKFVKPTFQKKPEPDKSLRQIEQLVIYCKHANCTIGDLIEAHKSFHTR